jgi:flagellar protein FlaG
MEVKAVTPVNQLARVAPLERPPEGDTQRGIKEQNPQENKNNQTILDKEYATNLVKIMKKVSEVYNHQLNFEIYEDTNRIYVQIVDKSTKEVIKQIPPEEMLELSAKIQEMVGIMLDKYV